MLFEVVPQRPQLPFPEGAERVEPHLHLFERRTPEGQPVHSTVDRPRDEMGPLEDLEMLRDGGEAHPERSREVGHPRGPEREPGEEPTAGPVRERGEQEVEGIPAGPRVRPGSLRGTPPNRY